MIWLDAGCEEKNSSSLVANGGNRNIFTILVLTQKLDRNEFKNIPILENSSDNSDTSSTMSSYILRQDIRSQGINTFNPKCIKGNKGRLQKTDFYQFQGGGHPKVITSDVVDKILCVAAVIVHVAAKFGI